LSAYHETMKDPERPSGWLLSLLVGVGIVAISCASLLIRLAEAPALTIATYRVTLATLMIAPYLALRELSAPRPWPRHLLLPTIASGIFLALHFVFWIQSLQMTSVASSVILVSTTPFFVAVFSLLWLRERLHRRLWLGIVCTVAGSIIIAGMDRYFSNESLRGDLLALMGALMAGGYLLTGRLVRRHLNLPRYIFVSYGTAAAALLVACRVTHTPLTGFSNSTYLFLGLLALVPQLIGHTTFNWTLGFLSPSLVAVLILGEPLGATLLAYLFLGEHVTESKFFGLCVVALGIVLASLPAPMSHLNPISPSGKPRGRPVDNK
jgi:drug/metabolite transporter (DMT)-like permease